MDVGCSTLCFAGEPFEIALRHIADLEFVKVDLALTESGPHLTLDQIVSDSASALHQIRRGPTLGFAAVSVHLPKGKSVSAEQIEAAAHFAKQLSAPVLSIDAATSGTGLDAEVARLAELERVTSLHGVILSVVTKSGTLTEDPAVATALTNAVRGLGLTLDPSHYVCGPNQNKPFDVVYPHVRHTQLRDTGRRMDQLQVKVGRGELEFGKVVTCLQRYQFKGALTVDIEAALASEEMDVESEVRKLRLLLESLI